MGCLGNILWIIFGGLFIALEYFLAGIAMCITIIGIPFGLQLFKLGLMALLPFGSAAVEPSSGTGCLYSLFNIVWLITGGLCIALSHFIFGILLCITVIGIPFGMQHFKLMSLALWPFGKAVV
mgnify:CR=1 FL=1